MGDSGAMGAAPEPFARADNWLRCVDCRWVFSNALPSDFGSVCPRCGAGGLMTPFPRVEAWHLIQVVLEHAARLDPGSAAREQALLEHLNSLGFSSMDAPELRQLAANARLRVERGGYDAMGEVAAELAGRGTPYEQALQLSLELLVLAGQASPDVEAVVVLAATALEALLDELWTETLSALGLEGEAVSPLAGLVRRSGVPRQRILLAELTGSADAPPFDKGFVARWDEVLERRNAVVHGRPFQVSSAHAREAVQVTADSVAAFAEANNRVVGAAEEQRDVRRRDIFDGVADPLGPTPPSP